MKIKVLYFGSLSDITGIHQMEVESISDSEMLKEMLKERYPGLKNLSYRISVNQQLVNSKVNLTDGDEVALLPPFSGG